MTHGSNAPKKQKQGKKAQKPLKHREEDSDDEEVPTKSHESHGTVRSNREKVKDQGQGQHSDRESSSQQRKERRNKSKVP